MATPVPKYYIVMEDGVVTHTDDPEIAEAAGNDGGSVVIDTRASTHTFDGDTEAIAKADRSDFIEDEEEEEEEAEDEADED